MQLFLQREAQLQIKAHGFGIGRPTSAFKGDGHLATNRARYFSRDVFIRQGKVGSGCSGQQTEITVHITKLGFLFSLRCHPFIMANLAVSFVLIE